MKRNPYTSLDGLGDEQILTTEDLATILQVSRMKAGEMLSTGTIEGMFRVGNLRRIRVKEVRAWIEATKLPRNQRIHEIREAARRRYSV